MLRRNNNISMSIVSNKDVAESTLPVVGAVVTSANLTAGAVVLVDLGHRRMSNTEYAALANGGQFMIVQGNGSEKPLLKTPVLTKGQVTFTKSRHKDTVQQVTTIGYNGTTGSLPAANNTSFHIKLRKNDNDSANQSQPTSLFAQYKTDGTGTQEELALGLAKNFNKNFADEPANGYAKAEVICDNAGAEALGANDTLVATKGSKEVVIVETGGVLPYLFVVGDFIRFGTSLTSQVYKITATTVTVADGGTLTLDRPATEDFEADSGVGLVSYITAANAATANFGIVITGIQAPFDVNKFRNFYVNRFTVTFSDADTLVSHTQGAITGNGMWQQVAMDEYMTYGFEGQNEMLGVPPTARYQFVKIPGVGANTALSSRYSVLNIAWTEHISNIITSSDAKGSVVVYLNLSNATLGLLDTATENVGETLVVALGLTAADFDMV